MAYKEPFYLELFHVRKVIFRTVFFVVYRLAILAKLTEKWETMISVGYNIVLTLNTIYKLYFYLYGRESRT